MDNNRKLTVEEFESIKHEMQRMYNELEKIEDDNYQNPNFNRENIQRRFLDNYLPLQNLLLSSDLSDIPFEEYRDLPFLTATENGVLDFSKTKANIDFNIVELDGENFNFENCNIRNLRGFYDLKEEYFDEKTIKENQDIFLSSNFPANFKEKYYTRTLSIEDFVTLTDSQIEEVSKKGIYISSTGFENFNRGDQLTNRFVEMLGLEKTVKLYKESPKDYQYLGELINLNRYGGTGFYRYLDIDKLKPLLSNVEPKDIKHAVYNYIRNDLINTNIKINLQQFTEDFIKENNDIFLTDINIPNEFRERYYNKQLTYEDIVNNLNIFEKFDYRNFMDDRNYDNYYIKELISKIDIKNFNYFIEEHRDVFEHLYYNHCLHHFNSYFEDTTNFEDNLSATLQKYILEWEYSSIKKRTSEDGSISYLPDWTKSMNYTVINEYKSFEELLNYSSKTFLLNKNQYTFINVLGIKNILKFERETKLFTTANHSMFFSVEINFQRIMDSIGKDIDNQYIHIFDKLKKGNSNYNDFTDAFFNALDLERQNYNYLNFDIIEGPLREKYSSYFISKDCPKKLRNNFYKNIITPKNLQEFKEYIPFLLDKKIRIQGNFNVQYNNKKIDFQKYYIEKYGNKSFLNLIATYGDFVKDLSNVSLNLSKDENGIEEELCNMIYNRIITNSKLTYEDLLNTKFKDKYPFLFLDEDVPEKIKEKFYQRQFSIEDLKGNPDLFQYFKNTNMAFGFDEDGIFLTKLFTDLDMEVANKKRANVYSSLKSINNDEVRYLVVDYIKDNGYEDSKIDSLINIASKVVNSNSSELKNHSKAIVSEIIKSDNPIESFEKIEKIFIKNNLPTVGKAFLTFEILHPNLNGFNFSENSMVSPVLKSKSIRGKDTIIFSDLIKASAGSNNRSMREYINNIKKGSNLFEELSSGNVNLNDLDNFSKNILDTFFSHLDVLYNNTLSGKNMPHNINMDLDEKLNFYINNLNINDKENIGDRLVSMFCHFAGYDSIESLENYMDNSIYMADIRNRERVRNNETILNNNDFIKGIGDIKYLTNILQNGSVAREYLGANAGSDFTPLDTDITMVRQVANKFSDTISSSFSGDYGPIWLVIKNDDRFIMTRDENGEHIPSRNIKDIMDKLEVFSTVAGKDTYGIRTGFASSNIDYIVTANNDNRIGVEIAKNGFYIPVVDKETEKVIFTPDDYDNLRSKMQGLSYYGTSEYQVSSNLETDEIDKIASALQQSKEENKRNREAINATLKDGLNKVNLGLKNNVDRKLETGTVELIDTGSTGRDTNLPGDGDYDFIMRLDREIISDPVKLENVKDALIKQLGIEHKGEVLNGNFRFKKVNIKGIDKPIDIDITFIPKTDKLEYSSDEALKDRFNSIKEQSSDKYNLVIANVIEAKKILKEAEVYKKQQGGISGIGIENWVLQNGGSFHDAATSFVEASKDKTVEEFKVSYAIWDFGENHYADEKGIYKHDNFIDNLTAEGYKKMKQTLTMYLIREKQKEDLKDILSLDDENEKNFTSSTTMSY